jgi:ABC-type amino acid transport substrate-binding protein
MNTSGTPWRSTSIFFLAGAALLALAASLVTPVFAAEDAALDKIKRSGVLKVALYKNFPPFSHEGKGVDVDLADALATRLGLKASILWFDADENMEDDLRNMVWKGHYLGYGPADVMLHVPVDREFMAKVDKVKFFAPYHRERYAIGRKLDVLPACESLEPMATLPYAIEGDTLAASVMLSADSGAYRNTMKTYRTGGEAVAALLKGDVAIAIAQQGELEGGLKGDQRFAVDQPPQPTLQKRQWAVGLAIKAGSEDLALALQSAMNDLQADGSIKNILLKHGVTHRQP